jgi:hypothetical protein
MGPGFCRKTPSMSARGATSTNFLRASEFALPVGQHIFVRDFQPLLAREQGIEVRLR